MSLTKTRITREFRDYDAALNASPKWAMRLIEYCGYFRLHHYRFPYQRERVHIDGSPWQETVAVHCVAILLQDGRYYMGGAKPSHRDAYNRKLGFRIALGRALKQAAMSSYQPTRDSQGDEIVNLSMIDPALPQIEINRFLRAAASNYMWGPPWG